MSSVGIYVPKLEINKKLLNSLPKSLDMNVSVIKKTKDLHQLGHAETMAIIKACDLDDKQREINHVNSYSTANLGILTNNAFSSFTAPAPQNQAFFIPQTPSQVVPPPMPYPYTTSSSKSPAATSVPKGAEENLALASGLVNCYNAFVAGELPP